MWYMGQQEEMKYPTIICYGLELLLEASLNHFTPHVSLLFFLLFELKLHCMTSREQIIVVTTTTTVDQFLTSIMAITQTTLLFLLLLKESRATRIAYADATCATSAWKLTGATVRSSIVYGSWLLLLALCSFAKSICQFFEPLSLSPSVSFGICSLHIFSLATLKWLTGLERSSTMSFYTPYYKSFRTPFPSMVNIKAVVIIAWQPFGISKRFYNASWTFFPNLSLSVTTITCTVFTPSDSVWDSLRSCCSS